MRIVIHENGSAKDIRLLFPTGLIFNPLSALIAYAVLNHKGKISEKAAEYVLDEEDLADLPDGVTGLSRRDLIRFCSEINRMKRIHKGMPLVDVLDSGGDSVQIYL